jgi:medium-chain acyl-[acyl-carrier-protein] hydrolase
VKNLWIIPFAPRPHAALRLFCFSYAGGSAHAFSPWVESIPKEIEVLGVQLPGRGARMFEPAYTSLPSLIPDLSAALLPLLTRPFALFGHSMGGLICFELTRYLRTHGMPKPQHLFVSGTGGPRNREPIIRSTLSDDELIEELKSFNGTPSEVFQDSELMRIMLPTVRADFKLCETYVYQPGAPLETPLTVFGGLEDTDVKRERLDQWEEETKGKFSLRMFPGDHFYLHTARQLLLDALVKDLAPYTQAVRAR